ncbi:protein-export membrane protein SecD [Candidatus Woesebacteria bacterium RIFCSPHIGHO2_01_FULL_44_21]|uniref:Protein translocase subunit SecD n=1 Tax=Candidatus Woesebacteria bacterium RIFCSPHIGHO2_01_FULL_44_21 TaxID=1802503 RepID=A0A1F7YWE3_9BACT|nr:MAG: protein-export membrane protein SecD [Candidatus Woesebacteria bacterium RIFCSPHIGHO2_01_FULL_44_21]OGM70437.1 MAG: protein-export membrane protein SecD [Candidatus Woesebacteria bacterium RIFCSPLOWO2_01_FULL_44_24b]
MYKNPMRRLFYIFVFSVFALTIAFPSKFTVGGREFAKAPLTINFGNINIVRDFELKLGLDLVGGSHFVFEAETDGMEAVEKERALAGLTEVVSQRINLFGVSEANVQRANFEGRDRLIVELPGVTNTASAKELIGKTAQLVFARLQSPEAPADGGQARLETEEVLAPTDLTGADVVSADVVFSQVDGSPGVGVEFTPEGSTKFEKLTEENVGKNLPILLDGQIVSAPVVQEKITGGKAQISGSFSVEDARALSIQINAGSLPVGINLIEERTIGPSLGAESIEKSVQAGIVGLIVVALFMVVMYGRLGIVADVGLILFGVYTLAIYKLIPVVLTLPGIAGFILSVGMAVDANILVFERYREERAKDASVSFALETAFGRAWDSIRDANIATLITAFILANPFNWSFLHTSGPVRGFALTLALGIFISLFTGVFISRNLLRLFIKK